MAKSKSLWFLVENERNAPVTFFVEGKVVISPYLYISERDALAAAHADVWPPPIASRIVARPGPHELFLNALKAGFPNTMPKAPDIFSLNGSPGKLLTGLVPLSKDGAAFADRIGNTTFWTELAEHGLLIPHAVEMMNVALGFSALN